MKPRLATIRPILAALAALVGQAVSPAGAAELHVAAAANLSTVLPDLSAVFERQTSIHSVPSLGATAQLTQQIENGAPFDVFLADATTPRPPGEPPTTTGFPISVGSAIRSTETKKQSRSRWAMCRAGSLIDYFPYISS